MEKLIVTQILGVLGDKNEENSGYSFDSSNLGRGLFIHNQYK